MSPRTVYTIEPFWDSFYDDLKPFTRGLVGSSFETSHLLSAIAFSWICTPLDVNHLLGSLPRHKPGLLETFKPWTILLPGKHCLDNLMEFAPLQWMLDSSSRTQTWQYHYLHTAIMETLLTCSFSQIVVSTNKDQWLVELKRNSIMMESQLSLLGKLGSYQEARSNWVPTPVHVRGLSEIAAAIFCSVQQ